MPKPSEELKLNWKPLDVTIKSINTVSAIVVHPVSQQQQQILQIIGLGDNNLVYQYDGSVKKWKEQD